VVVVGAVERCRGRAVGVEAAEADEAVEAVVGVVGEQLGRRVGAGGQLTVVVAPGVAGDAGEVPVGVVPVATRDADGGDRLELGAVVGVARRGGSGLHLDSHEPSSRRCICRDQSHG
jgi:hypothetical protein